MLMPTSKTLIERAEELLPKIDSIFCGTLSGSEARDALREGRAVLRKLEEISPVDLLTESLRESIKEAKKELKRCET